jgi:hypothetical protein
LTVRLFDMPETQALFSPTHNGRLLFATRIARLFAYGLISVAASRAR